MSIADGRSRYDRWQLARDDAREAGSVAVARGDDGPRVERSRRYDGGSTKYDR